MYMEGIQEIAQIGLEGAGVVLIIVICYKLLRMKSTCDYVCCSEDEDNGVEVHLENSGINNV
jgi:hypothetical protein